ncbi:MAG: BirA family transcriptional regulator [Chloroflexota bacterium]|nr:BirA family transcriptional regulator [Chloroflexota bacterium]
MHDISVSLAEDLDRRLRTVRFGRPATVRARLGSTQDEARRLAREGAPEGALVWAIEQTRGRGRSDRGWDSPPGAGLWFSVILRPALPAAEVAFITILAGVAVAEALNATAGGAVRLKWPNDLLLGEVKLGGILAEAETAGGNVAFVVLGVGVNLRRPAGGFDSAISPPPAVLADAADGYAYAADGPAGIGPAGLLAAVLASLEDWYGRLLAGGAEAVRARWLELSATIGMEVEAQTATGAVRGRAIDLAANGSLVLETAGGRVEVGTGEVIHLRPRA